jgi:hypothetical protein
MKQILICAICAASCGCTPMAVPVVKQSLTCDVSAELLQACGESSPIKEGVTFGEMIEVSRRDRLILKQCAQSHKDLAGAVGKCTESIDKHNASIREDEARDAAK